MPDPSLVDELKSLRIERDAPPRGVPAWAIWIIVVVALGVGGWYAWEKVSPHLFVQEVDTTTVAMVSQTAIGEYYLRPVDY